MPHDYSAATGKQASGTQRPVLCLLALTDTAGGRKVLLQRRNKKRDDTPYSGYLEVPQGKIADGASLASFGAFKLKDETGLEISRYLQGGESRSATNECSSELYVSDPLCCVVDVLQNHLAIGVVALVTGEIRDTADAEGHRWYGVQGLANALVGGLIFPLNAPILMRLISRASEFGLHMGL